MRRRHLPSHGPRVAQSRSEVIPEGDGVPATHTPLSAVPDQKVTAGVPSSAPLPFAEKQPRSNWLLALVITLATCAIAAVPTWLITADLSTVAAIAAALVVWCALLAAPALGGGPNQVNRQQRRQSICKEMNR